MRFNEHWEIREKHAFLSPSNYSWVNYTPEHLMERYETYSAAARGTRLHAFAAECIELGRKQPRNNDSLNMFVNDALKYHMNPEQPLYYSPNCFGTADAISFRNGFLRIHDLKTGKHPAKMTQLEVYAAIFCLEYAVPPGEIDMELRIYQNNEIQIYVPEVEPIGSLMDKIVYFDEILSRMQNEE